jgi:hypothetical protein
MYFQAIRGHRDTISQFKKWIIDDQFQGVYLFTGPKGVGKYTIARQLSKYLLCTGVKDDSCRCNNCKIFPESPDYLEVGQGGLQTIKVADAESIDNFTCLLPYKSNKRIVVIDDAENLNTKAANRLLKILEDLKSHNLIFLISSNPELMLPTVRSRTTEISFNRLSIEDSLEALKDRGLPAGKIKDMSKAIPYMKESFARSGMRYYHYYTEVPSFLEAMVSSGEDEVLAKLKQIEDHDEVFIFTEVLLEYLSDMLRVLNDAENTVHFDSKFKEVENLTFSWNDDLCIAFSNRLRNAVSDYNRGINLKIYPRVRTAVSWIYILLQNHLKKKEAKIKAKA